MHYLDIRFLGLGILSELSGHGSHVFWFLHSEVRFDLGHDVFRDCLSLLRKLRLWHYLNTFDFGKVESGLNARNLLL